MTALFVSFLSVKDRSEPRQFDRQIKKSWIIMEFLYGTR